MTKPTGRPVGRPPKQSTVIQRAVQEALEKQTATLTAKRRVYNRYDAAGMGRRAASWNPRKSSPNTVLENTHRLRERSRDATRNDWAQASSVQKWATSLVGIGITPRWKRVKDKKRKEEITTLFQQQSLVLDADGVFDYFGLTTLTVRTWFDGGECFARKRRRFPDDVRLPVPFQVQLLESDMVPHLNADTYEGMPVGNVMRLGIEFDKRGQRVAYWFYKDHPGDAQQNYDGKPLVRVAASEVAHVYEPKRPGQIRGVSESASILMRLRNIADYEDATLERQKLANLFVAFLKREMPEFDPNAGNVDPLSGKSLDDLPAPVLGPDGAPPISMEPGLFQSLEPGESMEFSNPPEAGTNYGEYMRTSHLGTAAGQGLPYELMSGDIVNVSDRTLRVVINEFRRLAEQRQWQVVIPMFCQRVIDWFAETGFIAGLFNETELADVRMVEHSPHGWSYIHPVQDPQGKALEIEKGLRSLSSAIAERGDDPDQVFDEQAADDKKQKALKIGPYSEAAKAAKPATKAPGEEGEPKPPAKAATLSVQDEAALTRIMGMLDAV